MQSYIAPTCFGIPYAILRKLQADLKLTKMY